LYELMTDDLDVWQTSSESEDEINDGWSTFRRKKNKKVLQKIRTSSKYSLGISRQDRDV